MSWTGLIPLDPVAIEVDLPSYVGARAAWYRYTRSPRRDDAIPFPAAPRATARKVTGVRPAFNKPEGVQSSGALYLFDEPATDTYCDLAGEPRAPREEEVTRTASTWNGRRIVTSTMTERVPALEGQVYTLAAPALERMRLGYRTSYGPEVQFYPAPVDARLVGAWAVELPVDDARHGLALPGSVPWQAPAAAERRTFAPPSVMGSFRGLSEVIPYQVPAGQRVWLRDPHPWIPAALLPPALEWRTFACSYDGATYEGVRCRLVEGVRVVAWTDRRRHELVTHEGGLIGRYTHYSSGNLLSELESSSGLLGSVYRAANRLGGAEVLLTIAAGALTLGAGAGAAQAALAGAGNALGAGAVAIGGGASSGAIAGAAAGIPIPPAAPGQALAQALLANAGTLARVALNTEAVGDRVLAEAALMSQWALGLDTIWGTLLRHFATGAQTPAARAELRRRLLELKAKIGVGGGPALAIVVAVAELVRAVVVGVGSAGIATAAEQALSIAQKAVSALQESLERYQLEQTLAAFREALRVETLRQVDELLAAVEPGHA